MRYKLQFKLENEIIPIQYRKCILSFIKKSLSDYDSEYYNTVYHEKDNAIKPFTFAVFFYQPSFENESIIVKDKNFNMYISFNDINMAIMFYNAFNNQLNKKFSIDCNSFCLKNISMIPEKEISTESLNVKFLSPLVVRDRNNNKDYYYSFGHIKFEEMLKINIREQLKESNLNSELAKSIQIKPIAAKKIVVKFYEKQMECSIGSFKLTGDVEVLNYLYKSGIGSRHSSGFGMFDII